MPVNAAGGDFLVYAHLRLSTAVWPSSDPPTKIILANVRPAWHRQAFLPGFLDQSVRGRGIIERRCWFPSLQPLGVLRRSGDVAVLFLTDNRGNNDLVALGNISRVHTRGSAASPGTSEPLPLKSLSPTTSSGRRLSSSSCTR